MRIDSNYTFEMPRACLSCADVGFLVILHQSRYWTALPEIAWTFSKYLRFDSASKAVYRSQRRERERDILWLDKPWSVRIVSIACHPSIHLSIYPRNPVYYLSVPGIDSIFSLPTYPSPSSPMWWDCRMCGVFAISGEAWYTTCELERVLWSATASFLPPRHPTFVVSGIKAGRIKTEKSSAA